MSSISPISTPYTPTINSIPSSIYYLFPLLTSVTLITILYSHLYLPLLYYALFYLFLLKHIHVPNMSLSSNYTLLTHPSISTYLSYLPLINSVVSLESPLLPLMYSITFFILILFRLISSIFILIPILYSSVFTLITLSYSCIITLVSCIYSLI